MRKIKILLVGMSSNLGGIENYLYNLVKIADKEKFQFDFLAPNLENIALENQISKLNCKIYKIVSRKENYIKHKKCLEKIFLNNAYDYIHINIMSFSWFEPIVLANKYSKAKIILHSHCGSIEYLKKLGYKSIILNKLGQFKVRHIPSLKVACSNEAGQFMFKNKEFIVFNNGIEFEKYKFNTKYRKNIREELNITGDTVLIGNVGMLEKVKNPIFLLQIFKEYNYLNSKSKLIMIGIGSLEKKIKKFIKTNNLVNKVLLLGMRNDVFKIYSALDIFVMPSLSEGLPLALLEAQVNGLNCYISSAINKESDISGNVNFLSLNLNPKQWAEKIYNYQNYHDLNIDKKIIKNYDAKNSYKKIYEYYLENV